jgi:hypothetical protein
MLALEFFKLGDCGLIILAIHIVQRTLIECGSRNDWLFLHLGGTEQTGARASGQHSCHHADGRNSGDLIGKLAHNVKLHERPRF